jgi:monodechloroaminopyrrolnitrin synthase
MTWTTVNDKRVAKLDPLRADLLMYEVPRLNAVGDLERLVELLVTLCERAAVESRSHDEVLAIVRDLGIVAGSIRRHGHNPTTLVPELERVLLKAAELTDMPARDTLMHYTVWNPTGPRQRTYTGHTQEPSLIESMRISLPAISVATRSLYHMKGMNLRSQKALQLARSIAEHLKDFLSGLNYSKNHVSPEVFITDFRPYFEPFTVGGHELRGPGAVTMPLHIFDFLLWGSSEACEEYQLFTSDYIPYNMSEFRHHYLQTRNTPSLLDRLEEESRAATHAKDLRPVISAVEVWFRRLRGFRGAHLKYATKAYHGGTAHSFKSGSGGHTTFDIGVIARLTEKHAARLEPLLAKEC